MNECVCALITCMSFQWASECARVLDGFTLTVTVPPTHINPDPRPNVDRNPNRNANVNPNHDSNSNHDPNPKTNPNPDPNPDAYFIRLPRYHT